MFGPENFTTAEAANDEGGEGDKNEALDTEDTEEPDVEALDSQPAGIINVESESGPDSDSEAPDDIEQKDNPELQEKIAHEEEALKENVEHLKEGIDAMGTLTPEVIARSPEAVASLADKINFGVLKLTQQLGKLGALGTAGIGLAAIAANILGSQELSDAIQGMGAISELAKGALEGGDILWAFDVEDNGMLLQDEISTMSDTQAQNYEETIRGISAFRNGVVAAAVATTSGVIGALAGKWARMKARVTRLNNT